MGKIYNSVITTKTGSTIPVFTSGKTLESRYNPENDAIRLLTGIDSSKIFFIVLGIGSGLFIEKLLEQNPFSFIIAVENSQEDIDFLKQFESVKKISQNERCVLCPKNELENILPDFYVPAFYGDMQIIENRAWIAEIGSQIINIKQKIQNALNKISADYSVQSHFGKIWQANIKNNLKISQNSIIKNTHADSSENFKIDNSKRAFIVAAGPTLDEKISYIKAHKDSSFIIATDTAFSTLLANQIKVDCLLSIDGQHISQSHFIHKSDFKDILFIFDLTSNPNAVKHVQNQGGKVYFCRNEHPLSKIAGDFFDRPILNLFTGSGTVTIAATDFAIKAGFSKIEVIGADFSYSKNKAYAKGTYLDSIYLKESNRLNTFDQHFTKLMYRTELEKIAENTFTTKVLDSYKSSFESYLNYKKINFTKENGIYKLTNKNHAQITTLQTASINSDNFFEFINQDFTASKKTFSALTKTELALLPAAAFFRRTKPEYGNDANEFLKLAYYSLVGYN